MNWNDPHIRLSLKELQETLDWRGRDSRVVRAAFAWSRFKKRWMRRVKQFFARPPEGDASAPRVLFWLAGGMGDAAGARRLVTAYRALLPNARFDVYSPLPGVARMLFGADKNTRILEKDNMRFSGYDLAVQTCLSAKFLHVRKDRLSRLAPAFLPVLERAQAAQDSLGVLLEDPFLTEGVLGRWLYAQGGRRFDLLAYTGGTELPHNAQERRTAACLKNSAWKARPTSRFTTAPATRRRWAARVRRAPGRRCAGANLYGCLNGNFRRLKSFSWAGTTARFTKKPIFAWWEKRT